MADALGVIGENRRCGAACPCLAIPSVLPVFLRQRVLAGVSTLHRDAVQLGVRRDPVAGGTANHCRHRHIADDAGALADAEHSGQSAVLHRCGSSGAGGSRCPAGRARAAGERHPDRD